MFFLHQFNTQERQESVSDYHGFGAGSLRWRTKSDPAHSLAAPGSGTG